MEATSSNTGGKGSSDPGSGPPARRSRKTSDLTSEQVTKKRAMDRANQRTYRAKNKAHVACLEDKIAELTYRLTEAEDRIRRQATVIRQLGGSEDISSTQDTASPHSTVPSAPTPGASSLAAMSGTPQAQGMPVSLPFQQTPGMGQELRMAVSSVLDSQIGPAPQAQDLITIGDFEAFLDNVGLDFSGGLAPNPFAPTQVFSLHGRNPFDSNPFMEPPQEQSMPTLPPIYPPPPAQQGAPFAGSGPTTSLVVDTNNSSSDSDRPSPESLPPWKRMMMHIPPSTHLEEIIINSSRAWRARLLQTAPSELEGDRLGPTRLPGIASLTTASRITNTTGAPPPLATPRPHQHAPRLNIGSGVLRSAGASADGSDAEGGADADADNTVRQGVPRPLSLALAAHIERSSYQQLTERIALTYKLSYLLRWMVCQTRETYEAMPIYMRPTTLQCTMPHPAWIDAITWPRARDAIIRAGARHRRRVNGDPPAEDDESDTEFDWKVDFSDFSAISGKSTSVGWPYPDSGAFIESPDGQYLMLHPLFETHIRKAENWTCSPELARKFKFMRPYARDVE